jgi:hypothetical protein
LNKVRAHYVNTNSEKHMPAKVDALAQSIDNALSYADLWTEINRVLYFMSCHQLSVWQWKTTRHG